MLTRCTDHRQIAYNPAPTKIEECETNNADLLVAAGLSASYETSGVLASADHAHIEGCHIVSISRSSCGVGIGSVLR